jgi:hypothetical protein
MIGTPGGEGLLRIYSVIATPGLVIDGQAVSAGRIPARAEVTTWVANTATNGDRAYRARSLPP